MLHPFIIEEIRRREENARSEKLRPALELPLRRPRQPDREQTGDHDAENDRGVAIIDVF